jgi:hypothetical protein
VTAAGEPVLDLADGTADATRWIVRERAVLERVDPRGDHPEDEQRRTQEERDGQQVRALVRACLQNARIDEAPALVTQLDAGGAVTPSGPRAWSLELERDDAPRVDLPDGPLPEAASHRTDAEAAGGELLIWVHDGRMQMVELPWCTDAMPTELPRVDQLVYPQSETPGRRGL